MSDLLKPLDDAAFANVTEPLVHKIGSKFICRTAGRARKRSPASIVLDATDGFIPLWEQNMVLHWRFNEASLAPFANPEAVKLRVREVFHEGILLWGDAVPIRFIECDVTTDFEIAVERNDDCTLQGCVLAQAFFPDAGRSTLYVFPQMFLQSEKEQVDTMAHELGHIFGLRHFFAPDAEAAWPSEIFGKNDPFTIMNYGSNSEMTEADKFDLKHLYELVWSGKLTNIGGTPIKLFRPYHYGALPC